MDSSTLHEYLQWLYALVESARPGHSYDLLFENLYRIQFRTKIDLDLNRAESSLDLKRSFLVQRGYYIDNYMSDRVSVLEVLIKLAYDMGDVTSRPDKVPEFFFELLENLGIDFTDDEYVPKDEKDTYVYKVCQKLINRRYSSSGFLFPLLNPKQDQRKVELWYQMHAYIIEKGDD